MYSRLPFVVSFAVVVVLTACGASASQMHRPAPSQSATATPRAFVSTPTDPQTVEAARAFIDKAIGRSVAGDAAGFWELLAPEDQETIAKVDYVSWESACGDAELQSVPYKLTDVRLEEPTLTVGIVEVLGFKFPVHAYYRSGHWRTKMNAETRNGTRHWLVNHKCRPEAPDK